MALPWPRAEHGAQRGWAQWATASRTWYFGRKSSSVIMREELQFRYSHCSTAWGSGQDSDQASIEQVVHCKGMQRQLKLLTTQLYIW